MSNQPAYERLAPFLREFIYAQAWTDLRPIQVEAIETIFDTDEDVLITAGTASGKTEAAFLPILSMIQPDPIGSVRVLYVGPLKALINDQFQRLELLCEQGGIPVFRWHGDVSAEHKSELIETPGGVLQITPESIESLLINKTSKLRRLFGGLRFIVLDEVHAFLESDRGVQLRSQLERLSAYSSIGRPRRIGLSATVGDFEAAKQWLNPQRPERVRLINPTGVTIATRFSLMHFAHATDELPPDLIDDLYSLTRNRKTLIFCNSRSDVELATSQLNRRCTRDGLEERYLPHHGSVSKEIREDAEARMKDKYRPTSVVCTNTLELGIDIGQLDLVVQINSTHSVMSFEQRLGRSGRRGEPRMMQLYTSEQEPETGAAFYERLPFSLLKALAVTDLFLERWIEPPLARPSVYNVLYHQLLSRLTEMHGCAPRDLVGFFIGSQVFRGIEPDHYATVLKHLAAIDHIQQMPDGELIVGLTGERVVRSREFYAVFQTPPEWDVRHGERTLGRISPSPDLTPGVCLLLVGRVWEVKDVLPDQKQVLVIPAKEARNVMFLGTGLPEMHPRVARRVRELLNRDDVPQYLSPAGQTALTEARRLSREINLDTRDIFETEKAWIVFPWTGTRAARTLQFLIQHCGLEVSFPSMLFPWVMAIQRDGDMHDLHNRLHSLLESHLTPTDVVADIPVELLRTHKFDEFLPDTLIRTRAVEEWVDWEEAQATLQRISNSSIRG
jgi:ATP-dependent Lhr-like helicase